MTHYEVVRSLVEARCHNALFNASMIRHEKYIALNAESAGHGRLWRWWFGIKNRADCIDEEYRRIAYKAKTLMRHAQLAEGYVLVDSDDARFLSQHEFARVFRKLHDLDKEEFFHSLHNKINAQQVAEILRNNKIDDTATHE